MKHTRVISYLALLSAPLLALSMSLSTAPSQARVEGTTTIVNTVLQASPSPLTANCLVKGGHTVLLGGLNAGESMIVYLTLESTEEIVCQMAASGQHEDLTVDMVQVLEQSEDSAGEDQTTQTETTQEELLTAEPLSLTVTPEAPVEVAVTFTAPETLTESRTEQVEITCGNLSGTFRLELIAPEPVPETSEPVTEPTQPVTDPTEAQTNENSGDDTTEDDGSTDEESGSGNAEDGGTDEEDSSGDAEDGSTDEEDSSGSAEDNGTGEVQAPDITITVPEAFCLDRNLPVKLTVSGTEEPVVIGLDAEDFPDLTRYSFDGGESWYQLYHGGMMEWDQAAAVLLLDFSRTKMTAEDAVILTASVDGNVLEQSNEVTVCEPAAASTAVPVLWFPTGAEQSALTDYLTQPAAETAQTEPTETTAPAESQPTETTAPVEVITEDPVETTAPTEPTEPAFALEELPESGVFENDYFLVPLPAGWSEPVTILERLTRQADGTQSYTAIELTDDQSIVLTQTEAGLLVHPGTTPPKAGTYRLTIQYLFEDTCVGQMQMTFFINYSTRSDAQQEEVPDNE